MPKTKKKLKIHLLAILIVAGILLLSSATVAFAVLTSGGGPAKKSTPYPWYFGGKISEVMACVLDKPEVGPTMCSACTKCTGLYGSLCGGQQEVLFSSIWGKNKQFACPAKGYQALNGAPAKGKWWFGGGMAENIIQNSAIDEASKSKAGT